MNKYKAIKIEDENGNKTIRIDEHRYIMEQHLGRKLQRNEVVHHINGNKLDNRLENLQLMSLSEHSRLHTKNRIVKDETKHKLSSIRTGKISKTRKLTKEDIIKVALLYKDLRSYRKVDRMFNFSNTTTRDIIIGKRYKDYQYIINQII